MYLTPCVPLSSLISGEKPVFYLAEEGEIL